MSGRRLVLIRHAKAADGDVDRRRKLSPAGTAAAGDVGRWLTATLIAPDRVVVSPARRAAQTWAVAARQLGEPPEPVQDERVYENTVDALLDTVRDTPTNVTTLVLVGHNPSMHAAAITFDDGAGDEQLRQRLAARFPTSAVAVFDVTAEWAAFGEGTLMQVHFP